MFLILILLAIALALFVYTWIRVRRWRLRPRRLCLACGVAAYPTRNERSEYRCPFCLSEEAPVGLDDPAAIAYLAAQDAETKVS